MNDLVLGGCSTTVLAHYLKALAIHRLISEQKDPGALSYWDTDGQFHLVTSLDLDGLVEFFLEEYEPSPVITPWNGGSGFFPGDQQAGIEAITKSALPRLSSYRESISEARSCLQSLGLKAKPDAGETKARLLRLLRSRVPDAAVSWLDAAAVVTIEDPKYPAILGSGGNDGRLDFANNFMQRIAELFFPAKSEAASVRPALIASLTARAEKRSMVKAAIGQFAPANAGGSNMTAGFDASSRVNRWDFVLAIEGALVFAGAAARRFQNDESGKASFPFHFSASASGFYSLDGSDGESARAEIWLPRWPRPAVFPEIRHLFSEGRIESSGEPAKSGLDAARAVASLGADRGIDSFSRVAILRRNGLAYLASSQGEFQVQDLPGAALLQRVAVFLRAVEGAIRKDELGAEARAEATRMIGCAFDVCRSERPVTEFLVALGLLRRAVSRSPKSDLRFPKNLGGDWAEAADDGSPEFAIALAIRLWLAVKDERAAERVLRFLSSGPDPFLNIVALAKDRILAAEQAGEYEKVPAADGKRRERRLPLRGTNSVSAEHLRVLLAGKVDRRRLLGLLWAMHLISWASDPRKREDSRPVVPASFALLRAVTSPDFAGERIEHPSPRTVLAILARLEARDLPGACELAVRRLRASGAVLTAPIRPVDLIADLPHFMTALVLPLPGQIEKEIFRAVLSPSRNLNPVSKEPATGFETRNGGAL